MISKFHSFLNNNLKLIVFLICYSSILTGFYLDENPTTGSKIDFLYHLKTIESFENSLIYALLNYDSIEYPTRISPVFLIYLYFLKKFFINIDLVRFISLNIFLISPLLFYQCLKIKFEKVNTDHLFLFSSLIYVSPSFRGNVIWPESSMLGLLFFLLSILFFLKFKKNQDLTNALLNILFLSIASYIRPTYSLFSIFFFLNFYLEYKISLKLLYIVFSNLILSFLAFYYLFVLKVDFISSHGLEFNFANKFLIISTIIFFYFVPFFIEIYKSNQVKIISKKFLIILFFLILIYLFSLNNFDYHLEIAGGGIFLHISEYLFNSNILFFVIAFLSILIIGFILSINFNINFFILMILFSLAPQTHIFHKYFDPLLIICISLLFKFHIFKIFSSKNLIILYSYFFGFYIINVVNSLIVKF